MINDINDIIITYNLLVKELYNFKNTTIVELAETEETNEVFESMKNKFAIKIFGELLKYVKTQRECALPNNNFINQLCNTIF